MIVCSAEEPWSGQGPAEEVEHIGASYVGEQPTLLAEEEPRRVYHCPHCGAIFVSVKKDP